ncbi:MAG: type II toxin-antitoxin system RelE family toxin [Ilumatobacteraceae bacterium]
MRRIDPQQRARLRGAIAMLAVDPRPPASRRLRGRPGFRVRVGDYRIIYEIDDDELRLVTVVNVGHRSQVYD